MAQEIRKRVERENYTCTGCGQDKDYRVGETVPGTFGTAHTDNGEAQEWYAHSDACVLPAVKAARGETSKANGHAKGQATGARRGRPPKAAAPEIPSEMPALEATG